MYIMSAFKEFITTSGLQQTTINAHYKNIDRFSGTLDEPVETLIEFLKSHTAKAPMTKTLLKYYTWRKDTVNHAKLSLFYKTLQATNLKAQQQKTRTIKTELAEGTMKNKKQLFEALETLYTEEKYKEFIINYILLNFHVRNMDLDLLVTKEKSHMNEEDNFLYLQKKKVTYIRNRYKTVEEYGTKEYDITDKKFIRAVRNLPMDMNLLRTKNIGREIQKYTIDNLSESQMNKIIIASTDVGELEHISESRGTSMKTLAVSYNPNRT